MREQCDEYAKSVQIEHGVWAGKLYTRTDGEEELDDTEKS